MNNSQLKQFSVIEDILRSIDFLDNGTLKETLAYIIKIYILDRGVSYDGSVNDNIEQNAYNINEVSSISINSPTFTELILELKKKYTIPELNMFTVENEKTFITIEGKKYMISHEVNKKSNKIDINIENGDKAVADIQNESPERFKNLEMD